MNIADELYGTTKKQSKGSTKEQQINQPIEDIEKRQKKNTTKSHGHKNNRRAQSKETD